MYRDPESKKVLQEWLKEREELRWAKQDKKTSSWTHLMIRSRTIAIVTRLPISFLQGSHQEPLQPSLWQHIPYLPQPHLLFPPPVPFLRPLHGLYQLPAELWPLIHLLPSPNAPAARSPPLDGPALHWLHEDTLLRGDGPYSLKPSKV